MANISKRQFDNPEIPNAENPPVSPEKSPDFYRETDNANFPHLKEKTAKIPALKPRPSRQTTDNESLNDQELAREQKAQKIIAAALAAKDNIEEIRKIFKESRKRI